MGLDNFIQNVLILSLTRLRKMLMIAVGPKNFDK